MTFEASDLHQLAARLANVGPQTGKLAQLVIRKSAKDIERSAKNRVPVDTGNLKSSIGTSDLRHVGQSGSLQVEIGPTANYGIFVELGTSRMAPQPYMGPAFDLHLPSFQAAVAQLGGEILNG